MELKNKNIFFFGTPLFAKEILEHISQVIPISLVVTQPTKPSGRGNVPKDSEVKTFAKQKGLEILECEKITPDILPLLKNKKPDIIITAAYGSILPESVLELAEDGAVNVHPSLLPKFRGPAPIQFALLNGESKTGTTIMLMDKGMDSGDILRQTEVHIDQNDNYPSLEKKLVEKSKEILLPTLQDWLEKKIEPQKQDDSEVSFSKIIQKQDGLIDWHKKAFEIFNMHRAFYLWPKIYSFFDDGTGKKKLILHEIETAQENFQSQPGEVRLSKDSEIAIATAQGIIIPKVVQLEGKKPMPIEQFVLGKKTFIGSVLE